MNNKIPTSINNSSGIAPVIGVIMMVSVTIIVSIAIASFATSYSMPDDHYKTFQDILYSSDPKLNLQEGLVARWAFDGDFKDSAGNNHGYTQGNVDFVDGAFGQAARFDGTPTSRVIIDNPTEALDLSDSFTIVAHVKWKAEVNERVSHAGIITKGEHPNQPTYRLHHAVAIPSTNRNLVEFATGTTGNQNNFVQGITLEKNNWYQITGVYNKQNEEIYIYVDGRLMGVQSASGDLVQSNDPVHIGGYTTRNFVGLIDEIQIYNRALSQDHIQAIVTV